MKLFCIFMRSLLELTLQTESKPEGLSGMFSFKIWDNIFDKIHFKKCASWCYNCVSWNTWLDHLTVYFLSRRRIEKELITGHFTTSFATARAAVMPPGEISQLITKKNGDGDMLELISVEEQHFQHLLSWNANHTITVKVESMFEKRAAKCWQGNVGDYWQRCLRFIAQPNPHFLLVVCFGLRCNIRNMYFLGELEHSDNLMQVLEYVNNLKYLIAVHLKHTITLKYHQLID